MSIIWFICSLNLQILGFSVMPSRLSRYFTFLVKYIKNQNNVRPQVWDPIERQHISLNELGEVE